MARKKVEKTPLSPKEAASKEFAMTSCVHSGDPSYRFEVGDSVSIGALSNIQSGNTLPLPRCRQCQNRQ